MLNGVQHTALEGKWTMDVLALIQIEVMILSLFVTFLMEGKPWRILNSVNMSMQLEATHN